MKPNFRMILITTAIFITLMLIISGSGFVLQAARAQTSGSAALQDADQQRTISVNGSGRVSVEPGFALIRVGVVTIEESASDAITQNNQQMESLLAALADANLADEDIQTQNIWLFPRYDNPPDAQTDAQEITGYEARNIVQVRIEDLDQVGAIIDAAIAAGGNTIESIQFQIDTSAPAFEQAREAALDDARQKAEQLATLVGGELGPVVAIQESSQGPFPFASGGDFAQQAAPPIEPGSMIAQVDVQVTWSLIGGGTIPSTGGTAAPTPAATGVGATPTGTGGATQPASTGTPGAGSPTPAATDDEPGATPTGTGGGGSPTPAGTDEVGATPTGTGGVGSPTPPPPGTDEAGPTPTATGDAASTNPSVNIVPQSGTPGTLVQVRAAGFPANVAVDIGVGRWQEPYEIVKTSRTDGNGIVTDEVAIPETAVQNERWVVAVATQGAGGVEARSNIFSVISQ